MCQLLICGSKGHDFGAFFFWPFKIVKGGQQCVASAAYNGEQAARKLVEVIAKGELLQSKRGNAIGRKYIEFSQMLIKTIPRYCIIEEKRRSKDMVIDRI